MPCHRYDLPSSRREFLRRAGCGFGAVALAALMREPALASAPMPSLPCPSAIDHALGRAKNVIFLFMEGGPSHLDTFDYKPLLNQLAGQPLPASFKPPITAMGETKSPLLECTRKWQQRGESGLWISDWFEHVAQHADDLAIVRSCVSDG